MIIEIKIPSPGESVTEVEIANWLVSDGDFVERDQEIAEIESDKATLPLMAEESGIISIKAETGQAVSVGSVACTIDSEGKSPLGAGKEKQPDTDKNPVSEKDRATEKSPGREKDKENEVSTKEGNNKGDNSHAGSKTSDETEKAKTDKMSGDTTDKVKVSPLAKKLMDDEGLNVEDIIHGLRRITKEDVAFVAGMKKGSSSVEETSLTSNRHEERKRMSMLRRNLSKRLVEVKNQTAMLTTFNEVDMSNIINIRKKYQSAFTEKHGIKLGFMSFFTKAVTAVLKIYPDVNSYIDGEDIVTPGYFDIGIAVQTEKGLMVPVIRNTETLSLADIERKIIQLAEKARKNRISIEDMTGGTFTITNGGIFGSLLSTPILNPPQSGILGMHNIIERPVAIDGKVEIRPMMYIALSYDHRIIDGRDSVGFLVKVKEILEDPVSLLFGGSDPGNRLLDL